jgi:hypothetical protein
LVHVEHWLPLGRVVAFAEAARVSVGVEQDTDLAGESCVEDGRVRPGRDDGRQRLPVITGDPVEGEVKFLSASMRSIVG